MSKPGGSQAEEGFLKVVDWDAYARYRPPYPTSLERLILSFHRAHSSSLRLAHDVGSGPGTFAPRLAEYFAHVHVSDSNATFVAQARERLGVWTGQHWWKGRFSFSVTAAEDAHHACTARSVDCVSLLQCAHWTEQEKMVRAAAEALASNGTLAIVQVCPAPRVVAGGGEAVARAVHDLFAFWGQSVVAWRGGMDGEMARRFIPQQNAGLECVPLAGTDFIAATTRRININASGKGATPHAIPGLETLMMPSASQSEHQRYDYTSDDPEGEGWRYEVDAQYFRGVISTMESEERLHLYEDHFRAVEELIQTEAPGGLVMIEWTAAVLLATRR